MVNTALPNVTMTDTRNTILEAALSEAQRVGFANVRKMGVAEAAGLAPHSVSLVLYHFGSMAALRAEMLAVAIKREILPIVAAAAILGADVPDALRKRAIADMAA